MERNPSQIKSTAQIDQAPRITLDLAKKRPVALTKIASQRVANMRRESEPQSNILGKQNRSVIRQRPSVPHLTQIQKPLQAQEKNRQYHQSILKSPDPVPQRVKKAVGFMGSSDRSARGNKDISSRQQKTTGRASSYANHDVTSSKEALQSGNPDHNLNRLLQTKGIYLKTSLKKGMAVSSQYGFSRIDTDEESFVQIEGASGIVKGSTATSQTRHGYINIQSNDTLLSNSDQFLNSSHQTFSRSN